MTLATEPAGSRPSGAARGSRASWIDGAKIAAILAVIAIHIYGVAFAAAPLGSGEWWAANVLYSSAFWAVPVFVMASGALLLGNTKPAAEFYRRRAMRIVPAILLFVPAYIVFAALFQDGPATIPGVVRLLASGRPYNHLYFLSLIAGLYAVTPLLARALRDASKPWLWAAAIGLLGMAMLDLILGFVGGGGITPTLVTWWIPYVGYYVLGYAIATSDVRLPFGRLLLLTIAVTLAGDVFAWWSDTSGGPSLAAYAGSYLAVPVVLVSVLVFLTFRAADEVLSQFRRPLAFLSLLTFGVYLGHVLVGSALFQLLVPPHTVVGLTPIYVGTAVLSFGIAAVVARLPVARRFIGL